MEQNRTSRAVEYYLFSMKQAECLSEFRCSSRADIRALGAIYEKYRKMESALEQIAKGFTHCDRYESKPCSAEAKEALAFDPLSQNNDANS